MSNPDHDLIGAAEAAEILQLSSRQVLRVLPPALKMPGKTGATLFSRAAVERAREQRAAKQETRR